MSGDRQQLIDMGFDPERVDCKLPSPALPGEDELIEKGPSRRHVVVAFR